MRVRKGKSFHLHVSVVWLLSFSYGASCYEHEGPKTVLFAQGQLADLVSAVGPALFFSRQGWQLHRSLVACI